MLQQEKFAEAGIEFLHVLEREPANPEVRHKLEFTLLAFALKAKPEEAARYYQQVVAAQPSFGRTYYFLGQALLEQGQHEASAAAFRRGLELDPGWPEEARQMAWGLATHPDPRRRNGGMAVRIGAKFAKPSTTDDPRCLTRSRPPWPKLGITRRPNGWLAPPLTWPPKRTRRTSSSRSKTG